MISITKDTCNGQPRISGTRVEVIHIINCLSEGISISEICEDYDLTEEQVIEAIKWTRDFVFNSF